MKVVVVKTGCPKAPKRPRIYLARHKRTKELALISRDVGIIMLEHSDTSSIASSVGDGWAAPRGNNVEDDFTPISSDESITLSND